MSFKSTLLTYTISFNDCIVLYIDVIIGNIWTFNISLTCLNYISIAVFQLFTSYLVGLEAFYRELRMEP